MAEYLLYLMEFVSKPAIVETFVDILLCAVPIWVAVMIGLVIGWSWRPRWTGLVFLGLRSKLRFAWTLPPGLGARRLWLAFTALSAFSVGHKLWFSFKGRKRKDSAVVASAAPAALNLVASPANLDSAQSVEGPDGDIRMGEEADKEEGERMDGGKRVGPIIGTTGAEHDIVTENDLEHLLHLLDGKDGDMAWQSMMDRSTSNLTYQAWRHEPEMGPVVYRSKTVFEDASPELVREFFWDDEFRTKWDPMLAYFEILEEYPHTGAMIVRWTKKFPFFCSDREYIIGRRIWDGGRIYYCVTKGVPYPAIQRCDKPRRVDLYFSSWVIKPVQSRRGDGQLSACEVNLVHYEDMGIPKDVAKLGVRHGMWGTVKKLNGGFRAYQHARKTEASLSRSALMARITTKISFNGTADSSEPLSGEEERGGAVDVRRHGDNGGVDWKWIVVGGTVALVCGLHTGVIGKALLLGAGHRVARR